MATRFIDKEFGADPTTAIADDVTGTRRVRNLPDAAGFVYDKVDHNIKYNRNGSIAVLSAGGGSSSTPLSLASGNFSQLYATTPATSGDVRAQYTRLYFTGAGGSGEALRAFATVDDVAANTVRGAHVSLSFDATGSVTGLGAALESTLHINNSGGATGTLYAIKAAINSDGAASDPVGATSLAYFAAVNQGDATGGADVDDDAVLIDIVGHTIGSGNMVHANAALAATHLIKIRISGTIYYLLATDTPA